MHTLALALSLLAASTLRVSASETGYISENAFLVACSDAAHDMQKAAVPVHPLTGTMPDPKSLNVPGLEACDKAASQVIATHYAGLELMLLTETSAFYYSEDCDICASLDVCDLKTQQIRNVKTAHSVSCEDLAPHRKGKILFDKCSK